MIRVALVGASGRMGRAVTSAALEDAWRTRLTIGAAITSASSQAELAQALGGCDVAIDFSTPASVQRTGELCVAAQKPLLIGVTALTPAIEAAARTWAERIALLIAPNTSLGVAVLGRLVQEAARSLGTSMDIRISESHHRGKRDAPSGTAKALGEAVRAGRGEPLQESDYSSIRAGDLAGEHTVLFAGIGEELILSHRATDRSLFARGALKAALWLTSQRPGFFRMADVLQKSEFGVDTRGGRP